jgi:hypothetical protein
VCNKCDADVACVNELKSEGRSLADAWSAPFFELPCVNVGREKGLFGATRRIFSKVHTHHHSTGQKAIQYPLLILLSYLPCSLLFVTPCS